jgi:hypothetical protein
LFWPLKHSFGRYIDQGQVFAVGIEPQTVPGSMWIISLSDGTDVFNTQKFKHKKEGYSVQ